MRFTTSIAAIAGLVNIASGHILMTTPKPFATDNSPLDPSGSNFPCKGVVYNAEGITTDMALGSSQPLAFQGSAVHGGGSCQISITYDTNPTKQSVWKVIHSIEGGCPMAGVSGNNGNDAAQPVPDTFQFTVPTGLKTGRATLAWTWFNKIGNREMYMNCAPINILGSNAKRSAEEKFEREVSAKIAARQENFLNSLPDMFIANIASEGSCVSTEGEDVRFPAPGQSVEIRDPSKLNDPKGDCGAKATAPVVEAPSTSSPIASAAPSVSPGEFAELPGPVDGDRAAENKPVEEAPAPQPEAPAQNETAPAPEIPTVGGSAIAPGTPCPSDEGMWNCVGGSQFQRCASGQWSVVQAIASGTSCASGISSSIKIVSMPAAKREIRFSNAHVRRHLMARSY